MKRSTKQQPKVLPNWLPYLDAARRKGEIAKYHLDELEQLADYPRPDGFPPMPSIPVQAHFEGVLISVIGTEEKLKEATKMRYGASTEKESEKVYHQLATAVHGLIDWFRNPLGEDIRCVRNLAVHAHYDKVPLVS